MIHINIAHSFNKKVKKSRGNCCKSKKNNTKSELIIVIIQFLIAMIAIIIKLL